MNDKDFQCLDKPTCDEVGCDFRTICLKYKLELWTDAQYQDWLDVQDSNRHFLINARQG